MTFNKFDEVRVEGDSFWVDEIYRKNYKAYFLSEDESEDGVITLLVEHERIEPLGFTKSISNLSKYRINQGKIKITKISEEIELSQKSLSYIDYIKEKYTEVEEYTPTKEVIIHLYPTEDTSTDDDFLRGYCYSDALFLKVKIYDPGKSTVVILENKCEIDLRDFEGYKSVVRVFKDKSTMISLKSSKNIKISNNQSVEIR